MRSTLLALSLCLCFCFACSSTPSTPDTGEEVPDPDSGTDETDGGALDGGRDAGEGQPDAGPSTPDAGTGPRYHQVRQKSVHNAFDKAESYFDQLVFHRARSVEIDIWPGKRGQPALTGDWYVYHADFPGYDKSSCLTLSSCLRVLRAFHDAFAQHEVVTVWLNFKQGFATGQSAADLDALFTRELGAANLFGPAQLLSACPSAAALRQAVSGACAWPLLETLRGKFMVVGTGGCSGGLVGAYVGQTPNARVAFIAPSVDSSCPFSGYASQSHLVFFNMAYGDRGNAPTVQAAGLIGRIYYGGLTGGLNDATTFGEAWAAKAHHLATDRVNFLKDPWSSTHQPGGWPFTCLDSSCTAPSAELDAVLGVEAKSAPLEGTADSVFFAHQAAVPVDGTWTAALSVAASHVEPKAQGCLMARASLAPDSPYVAICRPAAAAPLRAQARLAAAGTTALKDASAPSGLSAESVYFARLTLAQGGTVATAEASTDAKSWATLGTWTFASPLALQGVGVSGGGGADAARVLFGGLARSGSPVGAAALGTPACIGTCTPGRAFDGPLPP